MLSSMDVWFVIYGVFVFPLVTFIFANMVQSLLDHKKEMAEIESRTQLAKALAALSGETEDRKELRRALLEAYGLAGKDGEILVPMLDQSQTGTRDRD